MKVITKYGLGIVIFLLCVGCAIVGATLEITLIHTNDVHTRFEETDSNGGECTDELAQLSQCFGGVARRTTAINELRINDPNAILIDAGDQFQGPTLWFYVYKGLATAHFMEILRYDVMALGNHEFDNGVENLIDFLNNVSFPVISCNIDSSNEPEMSNLYACSHVIQIEGQRIAFIGYTTRTTTDFSQTGNLQFEDEIVVLREEVVRLQGEGIDKIIALGHSGIDKDLEIARSIPGVDVVVGSHSHTLLYTGEAPSTQTPYGEYPLVITPDDDPSRTVLVVQAYAYGLYLGHLSITFDDNGEVDSYDGNPILLDNSIEKDTEMFAEMERWNAQVQTVASSVVGQSVVKLDGSLSSCGLGECNLGNLLVDAMVFNYLDDSLDHEGWTTVSLAIYTAGSISSSLAEGDILIGQINQVLPYGNAIDTVTLKGRHLVEVLETAVANVVEGEPSGTFPQVSGIKVEYDLLRPPMERVLSVQVLCSECTVPVYGLLMDNAIYKVALNSYMAGGGGGFGVVKEHTLDREPGMLDLDVTISYISANTPIRAGIEGRITVYDSQYRPVFNGGVTSKTHRYWILITSVVSLLAHYFKE